MGEVPDLSGPLLDHRRTEWGDAMRRDDLMKPDFLSDALLLLAAAVMFVLLGKVLWFAMLSH